MNKTIFIAAMLAVATILAAGLTVLPNSVQVAQANPCADEQNGETSTEDETAGNAQTNIACSTTNSEDNRECNFIGNIDID